ncbi:MAG: 5' nucleotidase, NT5C type [Desertimonas sp.]
MSDVQFIVGVDLDGVVADHTRRFRDIYAEITGIDPETLPLERSWDFHEWGLDNARYAHFHRLAVMDHHMFRTMELVAGAADALWRLSDAGIWIRIITHRLYVNWGHEKAVGDTAAWLDEQRIPYRDLCFLGAKPQVEANVYIDDAPHNIEQLRALGKTVIVFDQPYNRMISEGPRAHDWAEAEAIISAMASAHLGSIPMVLPGLDEGPDRLERRRDQS